MIRRQVLLPAPSEEVWELLTAPDDPGSWLGGRMTWQAEEGGGLTFADEDGAVRRGVVEAVRPGRYLRYRWWPEDAGGGPATVVAYLLEADPGGTRLTVQETVAEPPAPPPPAGDRAGGGKAAPPAGAEGPQPASACAGAVTGGSWEATDDRRFRAWARGHQLCAVG